MGRIVTPLMAARALSKDLDSCEWLGRFLEIEADGGDSPGAFVQEALMTLGTEIWAQRLESLAELVRRKP